MGVVIKLLTKKTFLFLSLLSIQKLWALDPTYFKEKKFDFPLREQSIIISENGYYPNKLSVFKGERVRFFITSTLAKQSCFNIPAKNIFSSPQKGEIIEREVVFDEAGTFVVNCPNMSFEGRVTVLQKSQDYVEEQRRGLASDVVKVWVPKDTPTAWGDANFRDESELKMNQKDIKDFPRYRMMKFNRDLASEE